MSFHLSDSETGEATGATGAVVVIGSSVMDVIGRPLNALQPRSSAPGLVRMSPGGVARNVAENLARLGVEVVLLTAVGDDPPGRHLLEQAQAAGVDVRHALTMAGERTGMYLAMLDPQGGLHLALDDMGLVRSLNQDYLRSKTSILEQAQAIFLDANVVPGSLELVLAIAGRKGIPVAADPTSASLAANLRPHLKHLWLVTPNLTEAEILCPDPVLHADRAPLHGAPSGVPFQDPLRDPLRDAQRDARGDATTRRSATPRDPLQGTQRDPLQGAQRDPLQGTQRDTALHAARRLVAEGVKIALVTMAEFGVGYASAETSGHIPAVTTEVVDPTGAGDAQTAAVLFGLLSGIPLDESVRLGASAAALTLRTSGSVAPDLSLERLYDGLR
jgi:sugar/nucleoside kinase (ribokinase family)